MQFPAKNAKSLSWGSRIFYSVLVVGLLLLGIIGLILPIIPGLLFLFLAVLVLTRVSRRVARIAHNHTGFNRHMRNWNQAGKLPIGQRMKLGLLVAARTTINGIEYGISSLRNAIRR